MARSGSRLFRVAACGVFALLPAVVPQRSFSQTTAAPAFDVATIRPSQPVEFDRNGNLEISHRVLQMRGVTVRSCIRWAYGVQAVQVVGPAMLTENHYDIIAKMDRDTPEPEMRLMLRTLLQQRFALALHHDRKEMRAYAVIVAKGGFKLKPSASDGPSLILSEVMGFVVTSSTIQDVTDYLGSSIELPLINETGIPGRYDVTVDFHGYVDAERGEKEERPDPAAVINATLQGELGLRLVARKEQVDVLVVDHVQPPSGN